MKNCLHCGASSGANEFCCIGCKTAYKVIHSLQLNQYYDFCKDIYSVMPSKVNTIHNTIDYMEFIQSHENSEHSISLMIEGIKCGSCIWLIESSLKQESGILQASIHMSTLKITWIGNKDKINEFIKLIESLGYKAIPFIESKVLEAQRQSQKKLLQKIALSGVIWIQNMMISMGIWAGDITGEIGIHSRIFMNICAALLTLPILIYCSRQFFVTALQALKARQSHMDIPISIAIIMTLIVSVYGTIIGSSFVFYEAASSLIFALLIGRYFELKVRNKANEYAKNLILHKPLFVTVLRNNELQMVKIDAVKVNEIVYVASGERIPLDGEIIWGESAIDNSIITGESMPKQVKSGDKVFAGSINLQNAIRMRVESENENTVLAEIQRLIEKSEQQKSKYQTFAGKVARLYTPIVLILSLLTTLIWMIMGHTQEAILYGVSVLVITCPCAMGLAVPIVHVLAISNLMKQGIFIKSENALERLSEVTKVALDKTGVLTYGKPKLLNIDTIPEKYRSLLKALVMHSKHHLCFAILNELYGIEHSEITEINEVQGYGIKGNFKNYTIMLGRPDWCGIKSQNADEYALITYFAIYQNNELQAFYKLVLSDSIRSEAKNFVFDLKSVVNHVFIISGDYFANVKSVASALDIAEFHAELTPQQKYEMVKNHKILMIGDGLNDAAAMSVAHCSASPSNIVEISQNQSNIVFQRSLYDVLIAMKTAKKFKVLCKQNIFISIAYNVLSIPFAMLGYASPLIAAIFMSLSSLVVVLNTLLQMKK